jgi:hypothetical protein
VQESDNWSNDGFLTPPTPCKLDSVKEAAVKSNNEESTMLKDEITDFAYKIEPEDKSGEDKDKVSSTEEDDEVTNEGNVSDSNRSVAALDEE